MMSCVRRSVSSASYSWVATSWKKVVKWIQAYHNQLARLLDGLLLSIRDPQDATRGGSNNPSPRRLVMAVMCSLPSMVQLSLSGNHALQYSSNTLSMSAINCLSQPKSLVFERESQLLFCSRSPAVDIDSNTGFEQSVDTRINFLGKILCVVWPYMS